MKILYGVQGTGNGHITRARAMAAELKNHPVEVDFLFSGRDADQFFDMEIFGNYRILKGLTFITGEGKIRPLSTVANNNVLRLLKDIRDLDVGPYDLVLTDFEPVTAWAGRLRKKRVIGIGHQYAFHYPIPQHCAGPLQRAIINYFAPAGTGLGLHWHHFDQPVLPPIAPVEEQQRSISRGQYIVYLPFESQAAIHHLLDPFDHCRFRIYHPETTPAEEGHLSWHRPGRHTFQQDLLRSEGVICNAGFELASEVLQLGKKLLVKPVAGQSEQYSNAMAIDLLGYGHIMYQLDRQKMADWLNASGAPRIEYPNVAAAISDWILAGASGGIEQLSAELWRKTVYRETTLATGT